jgi:hypothetical protein
MRGHPKHGTNPLAEKLGRRTIWCDSDKLVELWKVRTLDSRGCGIAHEILDGEGASLRRAQELRAEGKIVSVSRL